MFNKIKTPDRNELFLSSLPHIKTSYYTTFNQWNSCSTMGTQEFCPGKPSEDRSRGPPSFLVEGRRSSIIVSA